MKSLFSLKKLMSVLEMRKNKTFIFSIIIIFILFILLPFALSGFLNTSQDFFIVRYIEIANLFFMVFLACYVSYWISIQSNKITLKKELCLTLIAEARIIIIQLKEISLKALKDNPDTTDGKLILILFKKFNNKIHYIDIVLNKINPQIDSIDIIRRSFIEIKYVIDEKIYNKSNKNTGLFEQAARLFDELDILFDKLRIQIV